MENTMSDKKCAPITSREMPTMITYKQQKILIKILLCFLMFGNKKFKLISDNTLVAAAV